MKRKSTRSDLKTNKLKWNRRAATPGGGARGAKALAGSISSFCRVMAVSALTALGLGKVGAVPIYYWDPTNLFNTMGGGSGAWNLTDLSWYPGTGNLDVPWLNSGNTDAVFGNFGGFVSVDSALNVGSITINADAYQFTDGGGSLTLSGSTRTITVTNAGQTARIFSQLNGTGGFTKAGAGTLVIASDNSTGAGISGGITISGGTLVLDNSAVPTGSNVKSSNTLTFSNSSEVQFNAASPGNPGTNVTLGALTFSGGEGTVHSVTSGTLDDAVVTFGSLAARAPGATGVFVQDAVPPTAAVLANSGANITVSLADANILDALLGVGTPQSVTGTNIPAGTTISAVNTSTGVVTLSAPPSAPVTGQNLTFGLGSKRIVLNGQAAGFINQGIFFTPGTAAGTYAWYDNTGFARVRAINYGVDPNTGTQGTSTIGILAANANKHVQVTGDILGQGTQTILTLNLAGNAFSRGIVQTPGTTLTLTNAGILKNGTGDATISGGTIAVGANEFIVRADSTSDRLFITSVLTGTGGVTKSGQGSLFLNAQTTGAVTFSGSATRAGDTSLQLAPSTQTSVGALAPGLPVNGPGVPAGTTVASVSGSTVNLNFTAPATGLTATSPLPLSFGATLDTASTTIQLTPAQAATLAVNQVVTGASIAPNTIVTAVNVTTGVVTLSAAPTASVPLQTVTFGGSTLAFGDTQNFGLTVGKYDNTHATVTANSNTLTLTAQNLSLVAGQSVEGAGIQAGTTIVSVSNTTVTLSQVATQSSDRVFGAVNTYAGAVGSGSTTTTLSPGQASTLAIGTVVTGVNVPAGTTVMSIAGNNVTFSNATVAQQQFGGVTVGGGATTVQLTPAQAQGLVLNSSVVGSNGSVATGTVITAINTATGVVTLSQATLGTAGPQTITFGSTTLQNLTFGGETVTFGARTLQLTPSQAANVIIGSTVTGTGIPANTTVVGIQDLGGYRIVTLSNAATPDAQPAFVTFGGTAVVGINSAYGGATRVNAGTFAVSASGLPAGGAVSISARAEFSAVNSIITNAITISGGGATLSASGGNNGGFSGAIGTGANDFQLRASDFSTSAAANLLVSGAITGSGRLTVPGDSNGIVTLAGNNSAFTGPVSVGGNARLSIARLNSLVGNPVDLTGNGGLILALDGNGGAAYTAGNGTGAPQTLTLTSSIDINGSGVLQPDRDGTAYGGYFRTAGNKTIRLNQLTIDGETLTVRNNTSQNINAGSGVEFVGTVAMNGSPTFNVLNTTNGTATASATASNVVQGLTFSGKVTGGSTLADLDTLLKIGSGTLVLANATNDFGGNGSIIHIQGGAISVGSNGALGNALNSILLDLQSGLGTAATLRATGTFTTGRAITLASPVAGGNAIEVTAGNTLTVSTPFGLPSGSENNSLVKGENGTLLITADNTGAAPWTGPVTINAGAVRIGNANALGSGSGNVTVPRSGAALQLTGTTLARRLTITGTGIGSAGAVQAMTGTNTISGLTVLTGAANTVIIAGADAGATLNLTGGITGVSGVNLTLNSGAGSSINITGNALDPSFSFTGSIQGNTTITSVSDTSNLIVGMRILGLGIPANTTITAIDPLTGTLTISAAATLVVNEPLRAQGLVNLVKFGPGNASLAVDSPTFLGSVTVNQGNLTIGGNGVTIGTPTTANATTVQSPSGVLNVNDATGPALVRLGGQILSGVTVANNNTPAFTDAQAALLVAGQQVFGANIPVNTTLTTVAQAAAVNGSTSNGNDTITLVSASGLVVGMPVSGPGIPANEFIIGINTVLNTVRITTGTGVTGGSNNTFNFGNRVVLSTAATGPVGGASQTLNFGSNRNLTLTGGSLIYNGNSAGSTEIFGTLTSNRGATNVVRSNPSGGGAVTLYFPNLTLNADSNLDFQGANLGTASNRILFYNAVPGVTNGLIQRTTINGADFASYNSVGGFTLTTTSTSTTIPVSDTSALAVGQTVTGTGIPAGATIVAITPNTSIQLSAAATANGTAFLTFGNANGIQPFATYNKSNNLDSAATTDTLDIINAAFTFTNSAAKTINGFRISGGAVVSGPTGTPLTLSSGAILASGINNAVNFPVLSFGGTEAFVAVSSGGALTIGSLLTGSGGFVKALPGSLRLNAPDDKAGYANLSGQTLTGNFEVNAGTLTLGGGNNTLTPNQFLIVATGATLDLNGTFQYAQGTRGDGSALQGNAGTYTNTAAGQSALIFGQDTGSISFGGVITQAGGAGAMSFLKSGPGNYGFLNANTYTGPTVFAGGINTLLDGGTLATSSIALNYARLAFNDDATFALPNRVSLTAPITLRGGSIAYTNGRQQTETVQAVGAVTIAEGQNFFQSLITNTTGVVSATLTMTSLTRPAGATATVRFADVNPANTGVLNFGALGTIGNAGRITIGTISVNGGAQMDPSTFVGANNNLIGPWAVVDREYASYIPVLGVGALSTTGFAGYAQNLLQFQPLATDNIRVTLSIPGLTADTTVNTLAVNSNTAAVNGVAVPTVIDLGGKKLTLRGGGLLLAVNGDNQNVTIQNGTITGGTVNVPSDLYIQTLNYGGSNRTFTISAGITDNGTGAVRLIKSSGSGDTAVGTISATGAPTGDYLMLSGVNTYSGGTVVNGGNLLIGAGGNIPAGGVTIGGGEVSGTGIIVQDPGGTIAAANTVTVNGLGALTLVGSNTLAALVFNDTGGGTTAPTVTTFRSLSALGTGLLTIGTASSGGSITATPLNPSAPSVVAGRLDFGAFAGSTVTVNTYNFSAATDFAPTTAGLILQGIVGSGGGITKNGSGVLQLNAQEVFTGGLNVTDGTVQLGTGNAGSRFSQLNLNGAATRLNLNGQSTVFGSLTGNGIITSTAGGPTLTVGFDNTSTTFSGQFRRFNDATPNAVGLAKIGTGTLTITSAQDQTGTIGSSGAVTVNGGGLTYSGAGRGYQSTAITPVTYNVGTTGTLTLDNSGTTGAAGDNRLGLGASQGTLALNGGTLAIIGSNVAATDTNETINILNFSIAGSTIRFTPGTGGAITLTVNGQLSNQVGQDSGLITGLVLGSGAGTANVVVSGAFAVPGTQGAGGLSSAIRPDLLGDTSGGAGTGFITRDSGAIPFLRPLLTTELATDMVDAASVGAFVNVGLTAPNNPSTNRIVASQTVNSITLYGAGTPTLSSGLNVPAGVFAPNGLPMTLTAGSGGILALANANLNVGAVSTGGITGDYHVVGGASVLTINGSILSSTAGIVKADAGTLILNARQYYTGTAGTNGTTVNGGTLRLGGGDNTITVQPTGSIPIPLSLFMNGGTLDLNGTSQIVERIGNSNPVPGSGGNIINSAASGTVTLTSATASATVFSGSIGSGLLGATGNAINFTKTGSGVLTLANVNTFSGATVLRGGGITLQDSGTLAQTSSISVNFGILLFNEALLNPLGVDVSRVPATAPVTLNGGTIQQNSGGSLDATAAFNLLNLGSGANTITQSVVQNAGSTAMVSIGSLVQQSSSATLNLVSASGVLGGGGLNNNQTQITSITQSGGAAATPAAQLVNGMLPAWITVNNGADFAGYLSSPVLGSLGVGGLGSANFPAYTTIPTAPQFPTVQAAPTIAQAFAVANSSQNLSINATENPVAGRRVNSVAVRAPGAATVIPVNLLTDTISIGSGGLLVNSGQAVTLQGGRISAGSVANTPASLYVTVTGTGAIGFDTQIVDNGNQSYSANTDGLSNVVTVGSTSGLVVGQPVSGAGIPAGSTITSINPNGTSFTISNITTAASFKVADIPKTNSVTTTGSNMVTIPTTGTAVALGMYVTGPGIPAGTTVTALGVASNPGVITLSNSATATQAQQNYFLTNVGNNTTTFTIPVAQAATLTAGMSVTNGAGATGIAPNTVLTSVNYSTGQIILSNPTTGTTGTVAQPRFQLISFGTTLNFARLGTLVAMPATLNLSGTPGTQVTITVNNATGLVAGMPVSGPGIPAGATILAFGTVTNTVPNSLTVILQAPTAFSPTSYTGNIVFGNGISVGDNTTGAVGFVKTGTGTLTLSPNPALNGSLSSGSTTVTVQTTVGLLAGMTVSGTGIPAGATIQSINGTNTFVLSAPATTSQGTQLSFGPGTASIPNLATSAFSNTYTGGTFVTQGTLALSGFAGTTVIPGDLTISNATVTMNTNGQQIAATSNVLVNGSGTLNLVGANTLASLTFNNSGGNTVPTVALGTASLPGTLTLNALTVVNDSLSLTPSITGTNSVLALPNNTITTSGASPDSLLVTVPVVPSGALVKAGLGSLILTPTIAVSGTTVAGSNTFTVTNAGGLSVGMAVSGTGLPAAESITAISGNTITITTGTGVAAGTNTLTFSGNTYPIGTNLNGGSLILTQNSNQLSTNAPSITSGNATITVESITGLAVGMAVTGTGIPANEYITAIAGNTITLTTGTGISTQTNSRLSFAGANAVLASTLGTGALNMANGTALLSDGTLRTFGNAVNIALNATFGPLPGTGTALAGNGVTLTGPVTLNSGGGNAHTLTVPDLQNVTTISGTLSGGNNLNLTKAGTGTLVLSNNSAGAPNTYSGTTTFNVVGGVLRLGTGAPAAVPTGLNLSVSPGAVYDINGNATQVINSLSNPNPGAAGNGGLVINSSGTAATLFVGGTSASDQTSGLGTTAIFDGMLTGSSLGNLSLTKVGASTLTLTGSSNYTGATTVFAGRLIVNGALGATAVTVSAGASLGGTGSIGVSLTTPGGIFPTAGGSVTLTGNANTALRGTIDLTNGSIGVLTIGTTGAGNALMVGTAAAGAASNFIFDLSNNATDRIDLGNSSLLTNLGGGVVNFTQLPSTTLQNGIYKLITFGANSGTGAYTLGTGAPAGSALTLSTSSGALILNVGNVPLNFFWKGGAGPGGNVWSTVSPSNFTSDAGGTTNTGVNLPNATSIVNFNAVGFVPGSLNTTLGANFTIDSLNFLNTTSTVPVTIGGPETLTLNNNLNMQAGSSSVTISTGALVLASSQVWINATSNSLTVNAPVSGSSLLTLSSLSSGRVILNGDNSGFTGGILVNGSTGNVALQLGNDKALGPVAGPNPLVVNLGAVDLNGKNPVISSLSSTANTGIIRNNLTGTTATLNVVQSATTTFSGALVDGTGKTALLVDGGGTLQLITSATVSNFSGGTTINNATLRLGNGGNEAQTSLGTGVVTINNNGILSLQPGSTSTTFNIANSFVLNTGGQIQSSGGNQHLATTGTVLGTINIAGASSIVPSPTSPQDLFLDGQLTGASSLTVGGPGSGKVIITNNNSGGVGGFTGTITSGGVGNLQLAGTAATSTALQLADLVINTNSNNLSFGSAVTSAVVGSLAGGGNIGLQNTSSPVAPVTLTIGGKNSTTQYTGIVSNANATLQGNLIKTGTGTFTFGNGASNYGNTYRGTTTVNGGGALRVNSGSSTASVTGLGSVSVTDAGTILGGNGVIQGGDNVTAGSITLATGTFLDPGLAPGTFGTLRFGVQAGAAVSTSLVLQGNSTYNFDVSGSSQDRVSVVGTATITGAKLAINSSGLTLGSYPILSTTAGVTDGGATPFSGGVTGVPTSYSVVRTANTVDLQRFSTIGAIGTPAGLQVIKGGSVPFSITVDNSAPAGSASLLFYATNTPGSNTTGSVATAGSPITVTAGSTSAPAGGLSFSSGALATSGTYAGTFTVSAANANSTNATMGGSVSVVVLDHASPVGLSGTTLNFQPVRLGYVGPVTSTNALTVSNAAPVSMGFRVDLKGSAPAPMGNVSLDSISGIVAGGAPGSITASLASGQTAGAFTQTFIYTFGDDSTLNGNNASLSSSSITVNGNVYTGQGVWGPSANGSWGVFTNWQSPGGYPGIDGAASINDTATFLNSLPGTVTLDNVSVSLNKLTFDNTSKAIAPGTANNGITLQNDSNGVGPVLTVRNGTSGTPAAPSISTPMTFGNTVVVTTVTVNDQLTISGPIDGAGGLTKTGAGTLTLSGTVANTYLGKTVVNGGTLSVNSEARLGAPVGGVPISDRISIDNAAKLSFTDDSTISANQGITVGSGGASLDVAANKTAVVNSVITGTLSGSATSSGTITKTGAGTLNIRNNIQPVDTGVNPPTLAVSAGTLSIVAGPWGAQATSTLLTGAVNFNGGGLAINVQGNQGAGVLQGTDLLIANSGGTTPSIHLTAPTNLSITLGTFIPTDGERYTFLTDETRVSPYADTNYFVVNGTTATPGKVFGVSGYAFTIDYNSSGNSSFALVAVPEAGTAALLCGAVGILGGIVRRRRARKMPFEI